MEAGNTFANILAGDVNPGDKMNYFTCLP